MRWPLGAPTGSHTNYRSGEHRMSLPLAQPEALRLRAALDAYTRAEVDDGASLVCTSAVSCRRSVGKATLVEGQASFLGSHYGLTQHGRELRILVVPQQVGGSLAHGGQRGDEHVTMDERRAQVATSMYGQRPYPRTTHMVGTEHALQVLLGLDVDGAREVDIPGGQVHVFETMAMANTTLCSRVVDGAGGQGSVTMIEKCSRHLRQTLKLLEPNIVLTQGWTQSGSSPTTAVASALGVAKPAKNTLTEVRAPWGPVALVAANHPSRNWAEPSRAQWRDLEPVIASARQLVLDRARD